MHKSLRSLFASGLMLFALPFGLQGAAADGHASTEKPDTAPETAPETEKAVTAARQVLDDFMLTFNARDEAAWTGTFNYPHVRFASGAVRVSDSAEDIMKGMDFELFAKATGWHHSAWDKIELVHAGPNKVHFNTRFSRYTEDGEKLATYDSLYIVTLRDGHWGVQARSSFAP